MDPITHTIIALLSIVISYIIGHYVGKNRGMIMGVAHMLYFFEQKVGEKQMRVWEKELGVEYDK